MNQQNLEYLKERLFFLGFGEHLHTDLEKQIKAQKETFKLPIAGEFTKEEGKATVKYELDFSQSKKSDMYFLNSIQATLKHSDDPTQEKTQRFYINKGNGATAKEMYNLLEGRAVQKKQFNKAGEPYKAWLQLSPEQDDKSNHKLQRYNENWGYDLEKSLAKHPLKELEDPEQKERLIKSLQKGNIHPVTFREGKIEKKMYLEANPKDRNTIVYDENRRKQFQGMTVHQGEELTVTKEQGQKKGKPKAETSKPVMKVSKRKARGMK